MYNLFVVYHKQKTKRQEVALDNFPLEEKEIEQTSAPQNMGPQEGEDIEFDENINIEDIQKILQQHIDESAALEVEAEAKTAETQEETVAEESTTEESETDANKEEKEPAEHEDEETTSFDEPFVLDDEIFSQIALQASQEEAVEVEVDAKAKKYVIYIDPENIEFIEQLSISERKSVINNILAEQDLLVKKRKREHEIKQYLRHSILATLTLIIGFPLLFILVNKSLEATIENYRTSQRNFSTLYREQGKIKQANPNAPENIKY
jgi:hypothetical protein